MLKAEEFQYNNTITVVNRAQFEAHYKLYNGYVTKYNEIEAICIEGNVKAEEANATYSKFRCIKRGESYSLNGVILHELYFSNIGGDTTMPSYSGHRLIEKYFGTVDNWITDFIATAKASRGWSILAFEQRTQRLMNMSLDTHDMGSVIYGFPLLVLDVYEHAYFLQYGTDKASYIENFMKNINWSVVNLRTNGLQSLL
ncbi:superoxide dismutase [Anaerosporobacter sp.]|uniref:superoxide dismutase n=1 Tax=Anaerosporobacter sp. TaxID=1872529 RepID=UPI00286F1856|nr:Fe-Mn family superoxide dismutase [Anaerosporobacter sp.]